MAVSMSAVAYAKMILHSCKYVSSAVSGVLLGSLDGDVWTPADGSQKDTGEDAPPPDALADVPADVLAYLCDGHGCGVSSRVRHGGHGEADLLTHLSEVRYVLKQDLGCEDSQLLGAALFHSIYGTEGFQGQVLPLTERPKLRALIGEHGEFMAYLNCVMDRASLDQAVVQLAADLGTDLGDGAAEVEGKAAPPPATATATADGKAKPYSVYSRPECGGEEIPLTRTELQDLMLVHLADWAQQVAAYSFWHYRRDAYRNIAATLGGIASTVFAAVMATEPADSASTKKLPEMVRARKLGVFDKVQNGEMSYEDLIDNNIPSANAVSA